MPSSWYEIFPRSTLEIGVIYISNLKGLKDGQKLQHNDHQEDLSERKSEK